MEQKENNMPIPHNWTEELASEWLQLLGYYTEVGVPVGVGSAGGRQEADVVGTNVNQQGGKRELTIYHVETGSLTSNHDTNVDELLKKFSSSRMSEIEARCIKRIGSCDSKIYIKVYVDIWSNPTKVNKLMSNTRIDKEEIKVWTTTTFFDEIFKTISDWFPEHKSKLKEEATIPEVFWMLKLLEALSEAKLLKA